MSRKPEKTAIFSSSPWCKFRVSCIMIGWERKCKQMRWLVEHQICPCWLEAVMQLIIILGKIYHSYFLFYFHLFLFLGRSVRVKVWEGLPPGRDEPPVEVKNILRQVSLQAEEGIKAWICYPSTSCLRGEIMTPNSSYDCRIKLRAGMFI